jgi:hypothetical protein
MKVDSELKEIIVDYIGNKKNPENDEITVELIVEAMAEEFPEFLMVVAEENFIRGYSQALSDINLDKAVAIQKQNEEVLTKQKK